MDQMKQHNIQTLFQFSQFSLSKKSIQILLSISVISFLLCGFPLLDCLGTFSRQLFSYTSDRNYIFLFCNGILVFLIKNSGQSQTDTSPPVTDTNYARPKQIEEEHGREYENLVTVGDGENEILITQLQEEEEEVVAVVDHEDEEEEEMGLLSAEELNKKCDDFIRKMREGIKMEPQQLIML